MVTPRNIQYDAIADDASGEDSSPDFFWESATRITARGWTLEIRIPFSSLRYNNVDPQTWGILRYRNFPRDRHYQFFSARLPRGGNCFICPFEHAHRPGASPLRRPSGRGAVRERERGRAPAGRSDRRAAGGGRRQAARRPRREIHALLYSASRTPNRTDLADEWTGQSLSGHAADVSWSHTTTHVDASAQYRDFGDGFRADTGFVPQVGFREAIGSTGWTFRPTGFLTRLRTFLIAERQTDRSGALISTDVQPRRTKKISGAIAGLTRPYTPCIRSRMFDPARIATCATALVSAVRAASVSRRPVP